MTTTQDYLDLIRDCSTQMRARYRSLDRHHHEGEPAPELPPLVLRIDGTFIEALPRKVRAETVAQMLEFARKGRAANIQLHIHASDPTGHDLQPYPLRDILTNGHN